MTEGTDTGEMPDYERQRPARKAFANAYREWCAALEAVAELEASPDAGNGQPGGASEDAFNAAVAAAYRKRELAIESIMDASPQTPAQLLQKFGVLENVAEDMMDTFADDSSLMASMLASFKADMLRIRTP